MVDKASLGTVANYEKASQGCGGGNVPHIRVYLRGRRRDGTIGTVHTFDSPRFRIAESWAAREPWHDQRRIRHIQSRISRWARRHGYDEPFNIYHFKEDDLVRNWYYDVV